MALECVWDKAQVSGCFPSIRTLLMDYPSLPSMPREGRHYGNPEETCARAGWRRARGVRDGNVFIGSGLNACFQCFPDSDL